MDLPPVRACLFDLDGLLIDSEDMYTLCTNSVLREYGKPDLPWKIKAQLQGRPATESEAIFQAWAQLPISYTDYLKKQRALQRQHFPRSQPLPGVPELLHTLTTQTSPNVHIALATSSTSRNFKLKTAHLMHIFSCFPEEQIVRGDDPRIPRGKGKPAPDIYLLALETINEKLRRAAKESEIMPEECLVFEDSVSGVEAGRRAGMRVVWVPHPGLLKEYSGREQEVLAGMTGEHQGVNENQRVNEGLRPDSKENDQKEEQEILRAARAVDDGRGELLKSLREFSYHHYGIRVTSN